MTINANAQLAAWWLLRSVYRGLAAWGLAQLGLTMRCVIDADPHDGDDFDPRLDGSLTDWAATAVRDSHPRARRDREALGE